MKEWAQKELDFKAQTSLINRYAKKKIEENLTLKRATLEVERQVCTLRKSLRKSLVQIWYLFIKRLVLNFNTNFWRLSVKQQNLP